MITSKRVVARPRSEPGLRTYALLAGDSANLTTTTPHPGGQTWPVAVEDAWGEVDVPEWATAVRVVMTWVGVRSNGGNVFGHTRSEEHTSELQSRFDLVCRLLLE